MCIEETEAHVSLGNACDESNVHGNGDRKQLAISKTVHIKGTEVLWEGWGENNSYRDEGRSCFAVWSIDRK